MSRKFMRGPAHIVAIVLGIGVPAGLTVGTLRTGSAYEVVATPRQVVDQLTGPLARGDRSALDKLVAPNVVIHRSAGQSGLAAFAVAASADAAHTSDLPTHQVSANANVVMVVSSRPNADRSAPPVVQIYRVEAGKIVEYWSPEPSS